jgi:autotransporter-associated beta strand protein
VLTTITARSVSATFTKSGAGTLVLSSANNRWYGGTNINAGSIQLAANNTLGGAAVYLANAAGVQLDLNNYNAAVGAISGGGTDGGNIILGSGNLTVSQTQDTTYSGVISGSGSTSFNAHMTINLNRSNTYVGGTNIGNATLVLLVDDALPSGKDVEFNTAGGLLFLKNAVSQAIRNISSSNNGSHIDLVNGSLNINSDQNTTFRGGIVGSAGIFRKNGTGQLTINRSLINVNPQDDDGKLINI